MLKVTYTTSGENPLAHWNKSIKDLLRIVNQGAVELESDLVKASPVGVAGGLKGGWTLSLATEANPTAIVGQNKSYFYAVEMGRKPGKGISAEGQVSVQLWAKRVLGLEDTRSFAYQLSRKYKAEGRKAQGFAGLAKPGSMPGSSLGNDIEPMPGGLIDTHLRRIRDRIEQ